jgi:hypothetical protein
MRQLIVYLLLTFVAIGVAGVYGAIHDQISYTISPEYFTRFKFVQFGLIDEQIPDRIRAMIVGFRASWWMGFPIGLLAGAAGFLHRDPKRMLVVSLEALGVVAIVTLMIGLAGLFIGYLETRTMSIGQYSDWYIPSNLKELRAFICVGKMHDAAYLGGILSIPIAWIYQGIRRSQANDPNSSENL